MVYDSECYDWIQNVGGTHTHTHTHTNKSFAPPNCWIFFWLPYALWGKTSVTTLRFGRFSTEKNYQPSL